MNKSNAENIRIKRDYFAHLKGPGRQSEASIDAVAKALSRFESYTRNKDFKTFRKDQAIGFTAHLSREVNERTGGPLSKARHRLRPRCLKSADVLRLALDRPGGHWHIEAFEGLRSERPQLERPAEQPPRRFSDHDAVRFGQGLQSRR
jgi:hypothetical protein